MSPGAKNSCFFFLRRGVHLLLDSDAGSGGIDPASRIVIRNRQTSHPRGVRRDNVVCGLFGGTTPAIQRRNEISFVYRWMKTSNASPRAIELAVLGKLIPMGLVLALKMKTPSTDVLLKSSMLHLWFVHWATRMPSSDRSGYLRGLAGSPLEWEAGIPW